MELDPLKEKHDAEAAPMFIVANTKVKLFHAATVKPWDTPYTLRFYLPSPFHPDSTFHTHYSNRAPRSKASRNAFASHTADDIESVSLILPRTNIPVDTSVYFQLFWYRDNDDREPCQALAASGSVSLDELLRSGKLVTTPTPRVGMFGRPLSPEPGEARNKPTGVVLRNEDNEVIALLGVNRLDLEYEFHPDPPKFEMKELTKLSKCMHTAINFDKLGRLKPLNDVVRAHMRVDVPCAFGFAVPFWMFACGPLEYLYHRTSECYWVNAAVLAMHALGVDHEDFCAKPLEYPEVLAQVVGQFVWAQPYLRDEKINFKTGKKVGYEQFSYTRLCPDEKHNAGDCEDGGKDLSLAFRSLRSHVVSSTSTPLLKALVFLASFYMCTIVDAVITQGKGLTLHMYAKLIPWKTFLERYTGGQQLEQPKRITLDTFDLKNFVTTHDAEDVPMLVTDDYPLPVLQLESTDRSLGDWTGKQAIAHETEAMVDTLKSLLSKGDILSQMHGRISFYNTKNLFQSSDANPYYHYDLTLSGFDVLNYTGQGALLLSDTEGFYGAQPFAGRDLPKKLKFYHYLPASDDHMRLLEWLQDNSPRVRPLVLSPANQVWFNESKPKHGVPLFVRSERGVTPHGDVLRKMLHELKKHSHIVSITAPQKVHLTDITSIELVYVTPVEK